MGILMLKAGRLAMRRVVHRKNQRLISAKSRSKSTTSSTKNVKIVADDGKTVSTPNVIPTLSVWQRLGPISTGINAYARAQQKRPYVTQLFSSLVIYFCGDLSAQRIGDEEYNPWRAIRSMITGGICSIPSYKWFMYLGQSFNYSSKALSLFAKVVANQIVFTPIFNSYFFGVQSLLAGDGPALAWARINQTVPISIVDSCKLWPAVTAFSFTYIQPEYRALTAGFVAIGWQSYLSWLNRRVERSLSRRHASEPVVSNETTSTAN